MDKSVPVSSGECCRRVSPLSLVAVSKMFERETRGQAVGFIVTLGVIGTAVIPYFLGLSGDLVSFRLGFCCSAS